MRILLFFTCGILVVSALALGFIIVKTNPQDASISIKTLLYVSLFLFVSSLGTLVSHFIESAIRGVQNGFFFSYLFKTQQFFPVSLKRGLITGIIVIVGSVIYRSHLLS